MTKKLWGINNPKPRTSEQILAYWAQQEEERRLSQERDELAAKLMNTEWWCGYSDEFDWTEEELAWMNDPPKLVQRTLFEEVASPSPAI